MNAINSVMTVTVQHATQRPIIANRSENKLEISVEHAILNTKNALMKVNIALRCTYGNTIH